MNYLPKARTAEIVVQNFDNEVLIYDLQRHKALCLNETAAFVWQKCDGKTTFDDLQKLSDGKFTEDLILLTLNHLRKENLLQETLETESFYPQLSRRQMIAKFGTLAVALPIISTMVAPTSANAQSLASMDCTTIPIPFPAGCEFGSSSDTCPTCINTLVQVTPTVCQSGASSISPTCTPNTDPAFVNCTGTCL